MHFIRSVIEHHRRGGEAEDVEAFVNAVEAEHENGDVAVEVPAAVPEVSHYDQMLSDNDDDDDQY